MYGGSGEEQRLQQQQSRRSRKPQNRLDPIENERKSNSAEGYFSNSGSNRGHSRFDYSERLERGPCTHLLNSYAF